MDLTLLPFRFLKNLSIKLTENCFEIFTDQTGVFYVKDYNQITVNSFLEAENMFKNNGQLDCKQMLSDILKHHIDL